VRRGSSAWSQKAAGVIPVDPFRVSVLDAVSKTYPPRDQLNSRGQLKTPNIVGDDLAPVPCVVHNEQIVLPIVLVDVL